MYKIIPLVVISILLFYTNPIPSYAEVLFSTEEISDYLLIGNGPLSVANAVNTNNFEFGANKAPVPSNSDCGPTLFETVPALPANTLPVSSDISDDGNIAIIDPQGDYNLQDVGVFADMGIKAAAPSLAAADAGTSNSFFNDPQFPNTFDGTADCTFFAGDNTKLMARQSEARRRARQGPDTGIPCGYGQPTQSLSRRRQYSVGLARGRACLRQLRCLRQRRQLRRDVSKDSFVRCRSSRQRAVVSGIPLDVPWR